MSFQGFLDPQNWFFINLWHQNSISTSSRQQKTYPFQYSNQKNIISRTRSSSITIFQILFFPDFINRHSIWERLFCIRAPPQMTKNLTGNSFITCQISMFWPPGCKNPSVKLNFTHGTLVKSQIGFFSTTFVQNPTFFPILGPNFRAIFPPDSQFL